MTVPPSVRSPAEFELLRRDGRRVRRGTVTLTRVVVAPERPARVAYAVGRRAGGAVTRNRIRRRLRAVVRELCADAPLPPGAYLVSAGRRAATLPYDELRTTVSQALQAVGAP